ncbi:hypothetical protein XH80_00840 [Bradyrhizobium sp. CCBAU 45384]|nr:hypothetical protein [Bradyrhizobium sp. CCBAU 45384]
MTLLSSSSESRKLVLNKTQIESRTDKRVLSLTCTAQFRARDLLVLALERKRSVVRRRPRFFAIKDKQIQASSR